MAIYNPQPEDRGYFYHVKIYEEMLLTYEQHLEREHGPINTGDPDDNTDYGAMKWYKGGSVSFAEKEWEKLVSGIRRHLASRGPLLEQTGDFDEKYFYYFSRDYKLKEPVLRRAWMYISHDATIKFDIDKFASHMVLAKR
ncbi:hypothetical protein [Cytobacillus massiliigabonensis]|uniref:hypothetical protein n=1 Tax=Cytobacillus massiliigabonensis TaxID=1871011 RepID=UPI000C84C8D0|nr:hypothetical protein [Cytobacillus massiliigabonensis]